MKYLSIFVAALLLGVASCKTPNEPTLFPCTIPYTLNSALPGSYWIYERNALDERGNVVPPITMDSLVLVEKNLGDSKFSRDGVKGMLLRSFSVNNGSVSKVDALYWIITPTTFYESTRFTGFGLFDTCCVKGKLMYRVVENCEANEVTLANDTMPGDKLPSYDTANKKVFIATTAWMIKNNYTKTGTESYDFSGKILTSSKNHSQQSFTFSIVEPSDAKLVDYPGKSSMSINDDRTTWVNSDIGIVKERSLIRQDTGSVNMLLNSYERRLVRATILR